MFKENTEVFEAPDNNIKIWRYMDFAKYVSLLSMKALYFSSIDNLGDKFEGSFTKANLQPDPLDQSFTPEQFKMNIMPTFRTVKNALYVNCWHMNEYESAAMWKLYLKSDEGVAIQSTYKKLVDSFNVYKDHDVYIGKIKYVDYETFRLPLGYVFYPILYKRVSFEHEHELRAVIWNTKKEQNGGTTLVNAPGLDVPVDIENLIENVHVCPTSNDWFKDLVQSVTTKYNLNLKVKRSSLSADPIL